jgi:hypothetical protein
MPPGSRERLSKDCEVNWPSETGFNLSVTGAVREESSGVIEGYPEPQAATDRFGG